MKNINNDILCFSHLRWGFVFQRPQHLLSRFARTSRVFFFEEPIFGSEPPRLKRSVCPQTGVHVITPCLPESIERRNTAAVLGTLLRDLLADEQSKDYIAWYYTPMALEFTADLAPELTVYDCMDELSAFANAPATMLENERQLFRRADLIFTGGASLFEAKRSKHENVHLFPSSVDVAHFARAKTIHEDPADQKQIPRPRIGYAGVIDERMDLGLLAHLADTRPDWQIVLLGPIVKIDPQSLPQKPNIHHLGMKNYADLPAYFSGWDVALLPFALNDATRFISPTKTPEYLAAGLPVVSTPIRDVERPYGISGLVHIGRTPEHFASCIEQQLCEGRSPAWKTEVESFLRKLSWETTWSSMERLMARELARKRRLQRTTAIGSSVFAPQVSVARV